MKILGTGLSGLVGSRIVELLQDKYEFENLSLETGVDITNVDQLNDIVSKSSASIFFHLAAKADVDGCEKDEQFGEKGDAWKINVTGTQNIVDCAKKFNKKIILVSTDFVFDGAKGNYSEDDTPSPINWYGRTKYKAEKIVSSSGMHYVIIRIAYPYRAEFDIKKDFVRSILSKLEKGEKISAVEDHVMTPTYIDDIARASDVLIEKNAEGIYHVVGSQFITPYDAAFSIADKFDKDSGLINKTTRSEYFKGRAQRPLNLSLKNDKIQSLGVKMKSFNEGLDEIKAQMEKE